MHSTSMHVFSTGAKFSNFTELHTLTLATYSYALLAWYMVCVGVRGVWVGIWCVWVGVVEFEAACE